MSNADRSPLEGIRRQLAGLGADLRELIALRWELARQESLADLHALRRLLAVALAAGVMFLSSLPLWAVLAAEVLDGLLGVPRWGWLLIFAALLPLGGAAGAWLGWRNFRRRFTGMEQTREELREDLLWLKEWTHRGK